MQNGTQRSGERRIGRTIPSIDISVEAGDWPTEAELRALTERAVEVAAAEVVAAGSTGDLSRQSAGLDTEVSILFTDDAAMRKLNAQWRGKDRPTNVLSFPQAPGPGPSPLPDARKGAVLLGDIVLAAETVHSEAALAEKPLEDHIAHLIIHGFLHLLGYDHEAEDEAEEMEQLERAALSRMGIADPTAAARTR